MHATPPQSREKTTIGKPESRRSFQISRKRLIGRLFQPKVLVPALLSAAMFAFLLTFTNAGQVSDEMMRAIPRAVLPVFLLSCVYLVAKGVQWWWYLRRLELRPTVPELLVPYAGGEMGNSLPLGVYLENYLLKGSLGAAIGRSSAATTWMLITEIVICLLALLVVGVPGWPWVRLLAFGLLVGMLLVGLFFFKTRLVRTTLARWQWRARRMRPLVEAANDFLDGGRELFSWQTFVSGLPLTAIYLGAQVTALYVIGHALNPAFRWEAALAAFTFSLVLVLLVPALPHLGAVEASGLGVMLQFGMGENMAAGSFLTLRILMTGAILLCGGVVMALLHHELGVAMRRLSRNHDCVMPRVREEEAELRCA